MTQLTLGIAMNCEQRQEVITRITQQLDESTMQELQAMLEQIIEEHLPALGGDNTGQNSACDLSATKEMFNISGMQSFDAKHNIFSDDDGVSSNEENPSIQASEFKMAMKNASP